MTALRREQILGADDRPRERVEVPEWGGHVYVRAMSGAERDAWEVGLGAGSETQNLANVRARLAALCMVDEEGRRLFADEDAEQLGAKSAAALERVFRAASRLNALAKGEAQRIAGE